MTRRRSCTSVYADGVFNKRFVGGNNTVAYVDSSVATFVMIAVDPSGNRSGSSNAFTLQVC